MNYTTHNHRAGERSANDMRSLLFTRVFLAVVVIAALVGVAGATTGVASAWGNDDEPSCWISASPSSVSYDGNTLLTWGSIDADDAWISDIGDVPVNGSRSVWDITSTKTYTLTVQNDEGTATCQTTVYVNTGSGSGYPSCSIYANQNNISRGQAVSLSWNSSNAQSANLSADGSVSTNGSYTVYPNYTTTYTLTVYGYNNQSNQCQTTVYVNDGVYNYPYNYNYYGKPSCTIKLSNYNYGTVGYNQTAQLSWSSYGATNAYLSPKFGSVATNGVQTLFYPEANQQYTLTVSGPGGSATCSTYGYTFGGSYTYPYNTPTSPFVYLSQIPYTGLDLGVVGTIVYFLALAMFAVAGGYLVVYYQGGVLKLSFAKEVGAAARNQYRVVRSIISK